ncbi:MAG: aminotransferase class I/II-fold pyridoxal phosphate-dependent enzyme [Candidatus Hydrogenedentota bacterium]|nr:MAG: aminotransferase class I/II-fold pyridoxal phosphate-dependent enzyme [Candidatus Hydrogenedentota bacterium]
MEQAQIQLSNRYIDKAPEERTLADFVIQRRPEADLFAWTQDFYESVEYLNRKGHNLYRRVLKSANGRHVEIEDPLTGETRKMLMIGSNSYLGLNVHPRVVNAAKKALEHYGVGAGSPPHFSGYYDVHRELEQNLAWLKGAEEAMIYPSGYSTNVGIISCLTGPKDIVIIDRLAHASIIDGCLLSGAKIMTFKHNDMNSLERVLKQTEHKKDGDRLVIVEGVYSMDGDIAPLDVIYDLVKKYGAKLMVDEAHATGVIGKTGKGSPEHFDLEGKIDLVMGTFSKSLGGLGGFVAAKKEVITYLRYYSRAYFFAASPTPMQVAAQNEAVNVLREEPEWNKKLWDNIHYFHGRLKEEGFDIENAQTAITPIVIGDTVKTREVTKFMHENNVFVNPVPYPAVPRKKDRLRLSLSALHEKEDLDLILDLLKEADKKWQIRK